MHQRLPSMKHKNRSKPDERYKDNRKAKIIGKSALKYSFDAHEPQNKSGAMETAPPPPPRRKNDNKEEERATSGT